MPPRRLALLVLGVVLPTAVPFASAGAQAQTVTIQNPSFEYNVLGEGQFRAPVTGWDAFTGIESYGAFNPEGEAFPGGAAPHGSNVLFLNPGAGIRQTLDAVLRPHTTYTLSYVVGQRADVLGGPYSVELFAGGTLLASDLGTLTPDPGMFLSGNIQFTSGAADAPLGQQLEIRVVSTGEGQPNFDLFGLVAEPGPLGEPDPWIPIQNPSFEYNVLGEGQFRAPVTGWDAFVGVDSYGSFNPHGESYPPDGTVPDGQNVLFLNPGTGIRQTLDAVLRANTTYTLSYLVGQRADVLGGPYVIELLAGGTVLASDLGTLTPGAGAFLPGSVRFTTGMADALLGQQLEIRIASTGDGQPNFDLFRLRADPAVSTVTPEPATWALLGAGLLGVAAAGRRRPLPRLAHAGSRTPPRA